MLTVRYGGRGGSAFGLAPSPDLVVVRSKERVPVLADGLSGVAPLSRSAHELLSEFELVSRFDEAGVEVLRARTRARGARAIGLRDRARAVLGNEAAIEFAGRVLMDVRSRVPVLYTENLFVKFDDDAAASRCRALLKAYGLAVKRPVEYLRNAYFVEAPAGTGQKVFGVAARLLQEKDVALCHPELIRRTRRRGAFAQQWHLHKTTVNGTVVDAHANVVAAWTLAKGAGITIAVIDDGIDIDHEEFRSPGKIVAPRDAGRRTDDPRPRGNDHHGTACAGVACADGSFGASGVAPEARLMPIRLVAGLGSQAEADAFHWAAVNGADVISCSWGPEDGAWWDASDPLHQAVVPLPDSTRLAIDWAIRNGRSGKGCVVTWAAGNGNEPADNDGYASYDKVIAVAACNDRGTRAAYSDFGACIWCAFPSSHGEASLTPGIWTTDRSGRAGYNPGRESKGGASGDYANDFGGTSSACPGVAGVAALVLSRNPALRWDEVKDVLRRSCDRIDTAGGKYDAEGRSAWYGYGRVNARKAVELALPARPTATSVVAVARDVAIRDLKTCQLSTTVGESAPLAALRVTVNIEHTYIGDLVVTLRPPPAMKVRPIVLHDRAGGGADNLRATFDMVSTPALAACAGRSPAGRWTLTVADKARQDQGWLRGFGLEMVF
jgi:subtilisin family serine protease